LEDRHVTASGREIALRIYTEHHNVDKTAHAMASLKAAMEWDDKTYGLECDLDDYKVVAVDHFNMGAMENKGLNIFNSQFILARPDTATDGEYQNIEAVIGHEYFHNWTGNRVTLRDWFQLSLKEGLTVFREQQFSAAMGAPAVKRINEVRILRAAQFPEDAGPMAHPVRPDEYMEINNFYTATVYMKGAEVIRMYHQLLGAEGFRRGMDLYFERHDGQAVTCDDFLAAMADANGVDLGQFGRWYSQAGTPRVRVTDEYDPETATYTLHVHQNTPPTPGQKEKFPLHMPMVTALVGPDGADMPAILENESAATAGSRALDVTEEKQSFRFTSVPQRPVPSLFRGFSAPVLLEYDYSDEQLAFLFAHDADDFNRWEAGQQLACRILLRWVKEGPGQLPEVFGHAFRQTLTDSEADMALVAEALTLPPESFVAEQMAVIDVEGIHDARESLRRQLGETLQTELRERLESLGEEGPYTPDPASIARRRLRSVLLSYLAATDSEDARQRCLAQYRQASNMTQSLAALGLLADMAWEKADSALEDFHARWKDNSLVLDKWFRVQATSQRPDTLERVRTLTGHPDFDRNNPNRVRALLGAFAQGNPARFHDASGAGYNLLTEHVMELDRINPQLAARLVTPLSRWRRYDEARGKLMKASLERIRARRGLSNDVYEIVSKSLQEAE
ncbi:MAG: aminopeptidase N, partial [Ectothiorhodospiraceae bacterium]